MVHQKNNVMTDTDSAVTGRGPRKEKSITIAHGGSFTEHPWNL